MHLKRNNINNFWPIPRKGTKYLAVPSHNKKESIPLVVVLRDILKIVRNKKELKKALNEKEITVNHKIVRDTNFPVSFFDIISIAKMKKNFMAQLSSHKKIIFIEVSDKDVLTKVYKILNKKILSGNKIQLNLNHGINIITKENVNIGDSLLINLKDNKIIKIIKLEKGKKAYVIKGKHAGLNGRIEDIMERGGKHIAKITAEKKRINVWVKNIIVIE